MSSEDLLKRVTVDPEICHGKPCVRGLRYPVETILEYLAGGDSIENLLTEFPDLERERERDILACHEFSRRMLAAKRVRRKPHALAPTTPRLELRITIIISSLRRHY